MAIDASVDLRKMISRPSMYFLPVTFDTLSAFINGFDAAHSGTVLQGIEEWLQIRLGSRSCLGWPEIAFQILLPGVPVDHRWTLPMQSQAELAVRLRSLLEEFWSEREQVGGGALPVGQNAK